MTEHIERLRLSILRILHADGKALSSKVITEKLEEIGYAISERTVRFHLLHLDNAGLTSYKEKHGRVITEDGIKELDKARVFEKVGFLTAKIDQMTYTMSYNLDRNEGTVVVNLSLLETGVIARAIPLMSRVYARGLAMGSLISVFDPGEQVSGFEIPDGFIGIGTVCSITINGILLSAGIPVVSRFGGLLELRNGQATRFVQIINYDGTSIDPLEIFIKSGMTDYIGATTTGDGQIGASFRELPAASREAVEEIEKRLEKVGLGAIMTVGLPGQSVFEIPVSEGHVGAVVIGGLNPVAILEESGMSVWSKALSGHVDVQRLFPYTDLPERLSAYC